MIDYNRVSHEGLFINVSQVDDLCQVMLLEEGRIVEFDTPSALLSNPNSKFYSFCRAAGKSEFAILKRMAGAS